MFRRLSGENVERGSALMAVIGVMAVLLIITLTVSSSSLQALTITTSTRAGVQAQAAAEAGIDAALVKLSTGTACPEVLLESVTAPIFTATVVYLAAGDDEAACAEATQVRIVSTGTALNPGSTGITPRARRTIEAVFAYGATGATSRSTTAAIYSYSGGSFVDTLTVTGKVAGQPLPVMYVRTNDLSCEKGKGNAAEDATNEVTFDLVVAVGDLSMGDSCVLPANVWTDDGADLTGSARINGTAVVGDMGLAPIVSDWVSFLHIHILSIFFFILTVTPWSVQISIAESRTILL